MAKRELERIDQAIYVYLQGDLPLQSRPYQALADSLQLSEEAVLERIAQLQAEGKIRRLSAVLRHREAGYQVNAMVVWQAPLSEIDRLGKMMAAHPAVSHCYHRATCAQFPWPLYTMVHAHTEGELTSILEELSDLNSLVEYQVIRSVKEFKKSSLRFDL